MFSVEQQPKRRKIKKKKEIHFDKILKFSYVFFFLVLLFRVQNGK